MMHTFFMAFTKTPDVKFESHKGYTVKNWLKQQHTFSHPFQVEEIYTW